MASIDRSVLSSLADGVEDLTNRVAALAERLEGDGSSDAANALYEAERSLTMASRALDRARRGLAG